MPGGYKNIKGTDGNTWKKGQSGNPKGRQRKHYKQHIDSVKKLGYTVPSREEYAEMVGLLLSMNEEDLKAFAQDKENPYWIRLIVIDLNDKKVRQKLMSDHRDWFFGKAKESIEINTQEMPDISGVTYAEIKKLLDKVKPKKDGGNT